MNENPCSDFLTDRRWHIIDQGVESDGKKRFSRRRSGVGTDWFVANEFRNVWNRRISPVPERPGDSLLCDHIAGAQFRRRERVFVPLN
jgi:hypothetical protein